MESITFKSRQQFLSEFFNKDRVDLLSTLRTKQIINYRYRNNVPFRDEMIFFNINAEVTFKKSNDELHIPFKNYINLLKPFIYFLYSLSKHEKFLKDCILYINSLDIHSYVCDQLNENKFCGKLFFPDLEENEGFNFLNSFTISDFTKGINEININLSTYYMNITEIEFVRLGGLAEDIEAQLKREQKRQIQYELKQLQQEKQQLQQTREQKRQEQLQREAEEALIQRLKRQEQQRREQLQREAEEVLIQRLQRREQQIREEREQQIQEEDFLQLSREEQRQRIIINASQCFNSEECVICYTNPPNVLFCNCGHICFCSECEKLRNTNICPICKTINKIIRVLN